MATIGACAIQQAFQDASMIYTHTNGYFSRSQRWVATNALKFIQGTGLEIHILRYGLEYDADTLRQTFFMTFHVKQT